MPLLLTSALVALVAATHAVNLFSSTDPVETAYSNTTDVPPPENVTVHCHNLENVAYWNYSQPSLLPRFVVYVNGYSSGPVLVQSCNYTGEYFCNISAETRNVDEHFYINVTALVGTSVSLPADSAPFSYSTFYDGQCKLDFPKPTLNIDQDLIKITFLHPLYQYEKLQNIRNINDYNVFRFEVITKDKVTSFECDAEEELPCTETIKVNGSERHCLSLKGGMNGIDTLLGEEVCIEVPPKPNLGYYAVVTASAITVFVIFLVFAVMMYKKITSANSSLPKTMVSVFTHQSTSTGTFVVKREPILLPESVDSPTSTDGLLKDLENAPLSRCASDSDRSRFMIGVCQPDASEGRQGSEGEADETETTGISGSGYDRPKLPFEQHGRVEMGPGDTVDSYRKI
ncbi:growth/differentiation factor 10b [Paramormyrops kingsleyae]|uniref:Interferon gamma receptor 1 n=1 Tax=Paramormyrops kingsleyae TaxID=1676925 RepID=A0A3B3QWL1_9TELE|nr:interferon gamma receptor 1 [Paramormyrops kingsleyae]